VDELPRALYHFDPLRRVLERLRQGEFEEDVRAATVYDDVALGCGALFVVSAMFWRTRFKYGLRGYRFALLECGHLVQNLLLAGDRARPRGSAAGRLLRPAGRRAARDRRGKRVGALRGGDGGPERR